MAVAHAFTGTVAVGTTSVAPSPGGTVDAAHRSLLFVGTKPETATVATPSGWTPVLDVTGGTGTTGADTGPTRLAVFSRDGTFSGAQTVTVTSGNTSWGVILTASKSSLMSWGSIEATSGNDTTGASAAYSATGAANPGWTAGDYVAVGICIPTDAHTGVTAQAVTATGISGGTTTSRAVADSGTGNDIGGNLFDREGVSGAASAAPAVAATFTASTNTYGPCVVVFLREYTPINPPTFVAEYEVPDWTTTTSPKTVTLDTLPGDRLVLLGLTETDTGTLDTPTGNGLTYTLVQSLELSQYCCGYIWTATDPNGGEGWTLSVGRTGTLQFGFTAVVFRGSDGFGASAKVNVLSGAPSLNVVTSGHNSGIVCINGDWNTLDGSSRVWRTVNGVAPTSGNGHELVYVLGNSAFYAAKWPDAGGAGTKTVGMTAPMGQKYTILAVEVFGTTPAVSFLPVHPVRRRAHLLVR